MVAVLKSPAKDRAIARLSQIVDDGDFQSFFSVDSSTGEIDNVEARGLAQNLPAFSPNASPHDLLERGILATTPKNLETAFSPAGYRVGRNVFVRTHVALNPGTIGTPQLAYSPDAPKKITHRAELLARSERGFWLRIDDANQALEFEQTEIFALNQPTNFAASGTRLSGVLIDYNEPLLRAHVYATMRRFGSTFASIDFAKDEAESKQRRTLEHIASTIKLGMVGRDSGYVGHRAGALLSRGVGSAFVQRATAAALLYAFSRTLAFDLQVAIGRTLDLDAYHGFLVLTLRPSMKRFVCDPGWGEPMTDLRVASFDAGWGHNRRVVAFEGDVDLSLRPDDIDLPFSEKEVL